MRRQWAAIAAIVMCVALGGVMASAQSPSPATLQEDVLFEVMVPQAALPDRLEKINLESQTIDPGADVTIGADNEAIRGRVLYVDAGDLVVTPMVDALVWSADASRGGTPVAAMAGRPADLATGDVILLPAISSASLDRDGSVHITNHGSVPAVTLGLHLHQAGGQFPGWPAGMTGGPLATASGADLMATISNDTVYRLTRLEAPVGARLPIPDDAALVFYRVEQGILDRTVTGSGGTATMPFSPGMGGFIAVGGPTSYELMAGGDAPSIILELAAIPSGAPSTSPAP